MNHTNTEASLQDFFGEQISVYTRQQAIDDGVLFDVTDDAKEAGFKLNTCVTSAVWSDCCAWTEDDAQQSHYLQDQSGRIWDVVYMAAIAARDNKSNSQVHYVISRIPRPGNVDENMTVTLKLHVGPGDNGEGVITIMQPHED